MKIFLTGATGAIGTNVLKELSKNGHEVTCLVRKGAKIECARAAKGSLENIGMLKRYISSADAVVHIASTRSLERREVVLGDILGTADLLDYWEKGNFIYMSSQVVYGVPKGTLVETTPYYSSNWYDIGKTCCELQMMMQDKKESRGEAIAMRMPLLMHGAIPRHDSQFLDSIYHICKQGGSFVYDSEAGLEIYGSSFLGINDAARGIACALDMKESGAYNFSTGFLTWKELIKHICSILRIQPKFIIKKEETFEKSEFRLPWSVSLLDVSKLEKASCYRPSDNLLGLVTEFVEFMEHKGCI